MPFISPQMLESLVAEGVSPTVFGNFEMCGYTAGNGQLFHVDRQCATPAGAFVRSSWMRLSAVSRTQFCPECKNMMGSVHHSHASEKQVAGLVLLLAVLKETRVLLEKADAGKVTIKDISRASKKLPEFQTRLAEYYRGLPARRTLSDLLDTSVNQFQFTVATVKFTGDKGKLLQNVINALPPSVLSSSVCDDNWVALAVQGDPNKLFARGFYDHSLVSVENRSATLLPKTAVFRLFMALPEAHKSLQDAALVELPGTAGLSVDAAAQAYYGALAAWAFNPAADFEHMCANASQYADFTPPMPANPAAAQDRAAEVAAAKSKQTRQLLGAF